MNDGLVEEQMEVREAEFLVLGPLAVRRGGVDIEVRTPKLRALMILLILEAGRVVTVDRLMDHLWAGDPPPQALISLRSYISNLRRLVHSSDAAPVIVTQGRGYALRTEDDAIDAVRFERYVAAGRDALADGDAGRALHQLDAALALWRGAPLIDVAYESFAQGPISRLEELRLTAYEERFDALLAAGRHSEAIPELEQFLIENPLRERPHRQLMLALYRSGRAPEALGVHQRFRRTLADELGLDPSGDIEQLATGILNQAAELSLAPERPRPPSDRAAPVSGTSTRPLLVGRANERSRLEAAIRRLGAGHGGVITVAGEPGIGKTALLHEFDALATQEGFPVWWGRCPEIEGAPSLWPWTQVLRGVAASLGDEELVRLTTGPAAPIAHLVPELTERTGIGDPANSDPEAARFRLYEAFSVFLGRLAEPRGLVVILDDVHRADASSLQLLSFVALQTFDRPLLIVMSYRDTPAERTPELDATLATVSRELPAVTFSLRGLTVEEVGDVLAGAAGRAPSKALVTAVHQRTGGNPFFVRQLAQLLEESDATADPAADLTFVVPSGVRHVIVRRVHLLPQPVQRLLETASVAGTQFDPAVVAAAAEVTVDEALDGFDVAAQHALVESAGPGLAYRFVHALIPQTLYGEMSPSRLARLHATVAESLEQLPRVPAGQIAEHLWRASGLVDEARPVRFMRAAAEEALALFDYEQAERYLRRALHLLAHHPGNDRASEVAVRLRLVQVITGVRGWTTPDIAEVAGEVHRFAGDSGSTADLIPLWWTLWSYHMSRGEYAEAAEVAEALSRTARDDTFCVIAGQVATAAALLHRRGDIEGSLEHFAAVPWPDSVVSRFSEPGTDETQAEMLERMRVTALLNEAIARAFDGQPGPASELASGAVDVAKTFELPFAEVYARTLAAWSAAAAGHVEEALEHATAGMAVSERHELHVAELLTPVHAWANARLGGDPATESTRIRDAIEVLEALGHRHGLAQWHLLLADVQSLAGDTGAACASVAAAREVAQSTGSSLYDGRILHAGTAPCDHDHEPASRSVAVVSDDRRHLAPASPPLA